MFRGGRCPIGLDLGAHSIKLFQLERAGGKLRVSAACRRVLPHDLPRSGVERFDGLVDVLRDMLRSGGFSGRRVVSCVPDADLLLKNLRLPPMPPDDLEQAVRFEAQSTLELEPDAHAIQFFDAGEVRQGEELRQEIVLMSTPHAVVQQQADLLRCCGLQPVAMDVSAAALTRCMAPFDPSNGQQDASVILDVGHHATRVVITRNGSPVFFKLIDVAGRAFDEAVAQRLGLSIADASEVRRYFHQDEAPTEATKALFGSTRRESTEHAVWEAMRGAAADLGREVGLCLRYYSVTFRGERPDKATLVGGGAHSSHLTEVLNEESSVRFVCADPFSGMDVSPQIEKSLGECASRGEWAVAAGLSMRALQSQRRAA